MDPETAHERTLHAMERLQHSPLACLMGSRRVADPIELAGLRFPNHVVAAPDGTVWVSDGTNALRLDKLEGLLSKLQRISAAAR